MRVCVCVCVCVCVYKERDGVSSEVRAWRVYLATGPGAFCVPKSISREGPGRQNQMLLNFRSEQNLRPKISGSSSFFELQR
jgi:hypothetical protein